MHLSQLGGTLRLSHARCLKTKALKDTGSLCSDCNLTRNPHHTHILETHRHTHTSVHTYTHTHTRHTYTEVFTHTYTHPLSSGMHKAHEIGQVYTPSPKHFLT